MTVRGIKPIQRAVFLDGTKVTPGTEECRCTPECEFPCWARLGLAPACRSCGCRPFPEERRS